jgi:N-acetylneuraminate synthase
MNAKPLFILEMANNHMGDVAHGSALIRAFGAVTRDFPEFAVAFKLQYRHLDTFIHASAKGREDVKYVKRFEETRLAAEAFGALLAVMRENGFITICTPFDEPSVAQIEQQNIEHIKIASCSFTDWPLLERIAQSTKPVIASTAGATLEEMDGVVSFFRHRNKDLTLMHCVAEYPTADADLALNQIDILRARYPDVRIGYSTHENPEAVEPVMMAVAKGVSVFEKHVALPTEKFSANAYSATPEQVRRWLEAARRAYAICGGGERREPLAGERASLHSLRRGVYATRDIAAGETLDAGAVEFAFPPVDGQLTANDWSKYVAYVAQGAIPAGKPVLRDSVDGVNRRETILRAVQAIKTLLKQGNIVVPGRAELEISHHYGMDRFDKTGLTMITVVNREYCKKLLVMLPGQTHPEQYHKQKEETFVVLHGAMRLTLDGVDQDCKPGDVITVHRGVRHQFYTDTGVVFEEISSTHYKDDSYYTDTSIAANKNRKTSLAYWMDA